MDSEQLEGEVQPHIKEAKNPETSVTPHAPKA